jgi:hypothetical protein|tara:strand:+ start:939 stop:1175 length:237 start_codon:yes stop_codon:yes gene_type:complete
MFPKTQNLFISSRNGKSFRLRKKRDDDQEEDEEEDKKPYFARRDLTTFIIRETSTFSTSLSPLIGNDELLFCLAALGI